MALTTFQKASRLFKRLMGVAETSDARQFFEEPFLSRYQILQSQIWADSEDIPNTAPGGTDGQITDVVQRFIDKELIPVAGTSNSFYHDDLKDTIPFNFGDGSYNYVLKDSTGGAIPFGQGDWVVDTAAGVLTFYSSVPANMPPKISFYKYVGDKGAGSGGSYTTEDLDENKTYSGETDELSAAETTRFGDILYHNLIDGGWYKSLSADRSMLPAEVMSLTDSPSGGGIVLTLRKGYVRYDDWNWTVDGSKDLLYASDELSGAGAIMEDPPYDAGDYAQIVGIINSKNTIFFDPNLVMTSVPE